MGQDLFERGEHVKNISVTKSRVGYFDDVIFLTRIRSQCHPSTPQSDLRGAMGLLHQDIIPQFPLPAPNLRSPSPSPSTHQPPPPPIYQEKNTILMISKGDFTPPPFIPPQPSPRGRAASRDGFSYPLPPPRPICGRGERNEPGHLAPSPGAGKCIPYQKKRGGGG